MATRDTRMRCKTRLVVTAVSMQHKSQWIWLHTGTTGTTGQQSHSRRRLIKRWLPTLTETPLSVHRRRRIRTNRLAMIRVALLLGISKVDRERDIHRKQQRQWVKDSTGVGRSRILTSLRVPG